MAKRFLAIAALCLVCALAAGAGERGEWQPLLIGRFGNIDALDSEDGDLAAFLKSIRNDGRYIQPMRTLVGPEIRNNTFFGLTYEAWIEAVLLAPSRPGALHTVWVFPVENRDEYMTQLANQGLSEYEGMDGVTVLREMDQDGNIRTWYLEWLPGNVAVFGASREAVSAGRLVYAENSAARGLLAGVGGQYVSPDLILRLDPGRLASWQDNEPGQYWWRETVERFAEDLVHYWRPSPARVRLLRAMTEEFITWPRRLRRLDCSVWFERDGVEWRLELAGDFPAAPRDELDILRALPAGSAMAYAVPLDSQAFTGIGQAAARLLLGGAGGVVTAEARQKAQEIFDALLAAGPRHAAAAWVAPPAGRPDLGASRLLLTAWDRPEMLDSAWNAFDQAVRPGTAASQAFSQLGWEVTVTRDELDSGAASVTIHPVAGRSTEPYYDGILVFRRQGNMTALVSGKGRVDAAEQRRVVAHRASIASEAVAQTSEGTPDVRQTFTRIGGRGASVAGFFEPVRFMQLALLELADWRPRSPDQHEPLSTQLAREMLEYGSAGAWTMAGESETGLWRIQGGIPWQSLARLSGALGITESIGME